MTVFSISLAPLSIATCLLPPVTWAQSSSSLTPASLASASLTTSIR